MEITKFFNNEFRQFANYDNSTSLPSLMDGLKVTERKLLYAFIHHIGPNKIVVDKAGMRAADLTKYHHGAGNMMGVLVNMNQDFPGSNNLPLFKKSGQFGTRIDHDASSERYISTTLGSAHKKLFDPADNLFLKKQYDDGDEIEPEFFLPKLPLLLINGSKGTGNGYASHVLSYDPNEIKTAVEEVLATGLVQTKLTPFLNGYHGSVSKDHTTGQVTFEGSFERKGANTIIITELTPSRQMQSYKEILKELLQKQGKTQDLPPLIKDFENESTEAGWRFIIDVPRSTAQMSDQELAKMFKLTERQTENLTVWLPNGKLKRFPNTESLIEAWVGYRLGYYEERRQDQLSRQNEELKWLKTKMQFIKWWNHSAEFLVTLKKVDLRHQVSQLTLNEDYIDRLLSIRISNLGLEEVQELEKDIMKITKLIEALELTTNKKMMVKELKELKLE